MKANSGLVAYLDSLTQREFGMSRSIVPLVRLPCPDKLRSPELPIDYWCLSALISGPSLFDFLHFYRIPRTIWAMIRLNQHTRMESFDLQLDFCICQIQLVGITYW